MEDRIIPRTTHHAPPLSPALIRHFRARLLSWFAEHGRSLPWRRTRDPYRVLVSEFMLQQTQASRVVEYYPRFIKRFSSIAALAHARPSAVREAWSGLGYYARASNIHALARVVRRDFAGRLPAEPAELVKLPGVGRYTAGAVACFAYEKAVAAVDTNVARVIRRVFFGEGGKGKGEEQIWQVAEALVPKHGKSAWAFNQGIMELGATVCSARTPKCPECPVMRDCKTGRLTSC